VKLFFILFSFWVSSLAYAAEPLYETLHEDSVTVLKDPKRVFFDYIVLYPESNSIIRYEINCKDQTIFVQRIEMRANGSKTPTYIENETHLPRVILKTDKFYPLYFKYCS
jgi:hypothetical protein